MLEEGKFHDETLGDVLSRLPMKSRARFKCVSKRWLRLISDPNRVRPRKSHVGLVSQTFISPTLHTINFLRVDPRATAFLLQIDSFRHLRNNYLLESSCNGFLLFRNRLVSKDHGEDYLVYHPFTQRYWNLLPPKGSKTTVCAGLASKGPHFKMVRIVFPDLTFIGQHKTVGCQVYSSRNGEWWELSPPSYLTTLTRVRLVPLVRGSDSVFVRRGLHWIFFSYLLIYHLDDADCEWVSLPMLYLDDHDAYEEQMGWIGGCHYSAHKTNCIWESEGCLNYCKVFYNRRIGIWSLHRENSSSKRNKDDFEWKVKHKGILTPPFVARDFFRPIAFNAEFAMVYLMCSRQVFSYNLATGEIKAACASPTCEGFSFRPRCVALPFLFLDYGGMENREPTP